MLLSSEHVDKENLVCISLSYDLRPAWFIIWYYAFGAVAKVVRKNSLFFCPVVQTSQSSFRLSSSFGLRSWTDNEKQRQLEFLDSTERNFSVASRWSCKPLKPILKTSKVISLMAASSPVHNDSSSTLTRDIVNHLFSKQQLQIRSWTEKEKQEQLITDSLTRLRVTPLLHRLQTLSK